MIRETLAAIALLVIITVPTALAAPPQAAPNWVVTVPDNNVSLGSPIQFFVSGPANGTFNVSAYPLFINVSQGPVFFHAYKLGNATGANNHSAVSLAISIPTRVLTYGGYRLSIQNTSIPFVIGAPTFYLVQPVNTTGVAANLAIAWEELNITVLREQSLLYQQTILEHQQEEYFWISVAEFILLCITIFFTRTGAANSRWGRMVRRWFHDLFWSRADSDPWEGGAAPNPVPQPDVTRVWVSKLFPECDTCSVPTGKQEKILHLRQDHMVPEPKLGRDYERRIDSVKLAMSKLDEPEPSTSRLYEALDEIPKDAFDDIERSLPPGADLPPRGPMIYRKPEGT